LLDQIGVPDNLRNYQGLQSQWYQKLVEDGFVLSPPKPLFPRLELAEADA